MNTTDAFPGSRLPGPGSRPRILVIGIGNEFRQDDGVGIEAARRLRRLSLPGAVVLERGGEGTDLMEAWEGSTDVLVIDALSSGAAAGTVHRFEYGPGAGGGAPVPLSRCFRGTSHQIGLGEAIELAAAIGALPARLVVYGIEGQAFGEGAGLTPAVARAVDGVVARIVEDIARWSR